MININNRIIFTSMVNLIILINRVILMIMTIMVIIISRVIMIILIICIILIILLIMMTHRNQVNEYLDRLREHTVTKLWEMTEKMNILYPANWTRLVNHQCTMCILGSTMALWSNGCSHKNTFSWENNSFEAIFIGPESDHWQCLSLTDSLTH